MIVHVVINQENINEPVSLFADLRSAVDNYNIRIANGETAKMYATEL